MIHTTIQVTLITSVSIILCIFTIFRLSPSELSIDIKNKITVAPSTPTNTLPINESLSVHELEQKYNELMEEIQNKLYNTTYISHRDINIHAYDEYIELLELGDAIIPFLETTLSSYDINSHIEQEYKLHDIALSIYYEVIYRSELEKLNNNPNDAIKKHYMFNSSYNLYINKVFNIIEIEEVLRHKVSDDQLIIYALMTNRKINYSNSYDRYNQIKCSIRIVNDKYVVEKMTVYDLDSFNKELSEFDIELQPKYIHNHYQIMTKKLNNRNIYGAHHLSYSDIETIKTNMMPNIITGTPSNTYYALKQGLWEYILENEKHDSNILQLYSILEINHNKTDDKSIDALVLATNYNEAQNTNRPQILYRVSAAFDDNWNIENITTKNISKLHRNSQIDYIKEITKDCASINMSPVEVLTILNKELTDEHNKYGVQSQQTNYLIPYTHAASTAINLQYFQGAPYWVRTDLLDNHSTIIKTFSVESFPSPSINPQSFEPFLSAQWQDENPQQKFNQETIKNIQSIRLHFIDPDIKLVKVKLNLYLDIKRVIMSIEYADKTINQYMTDDTNVYDSLYNEFFEKN